MDIVLKKKQQDQSGFKITHNLTDRDNKVSSGNDDSKKSPQIFIFSQQTIDHDDDLVGTDNEVIISDSEQEREYASLKQAELDEFQKGQEEIDKLIEEKEATEIREKIELEK